MIKSIQISNFQSHKDTKIELSPGVNVIIGPSDSGKSAIFRAANWPINNKPGGEAFRSNWGGDTIVELETTDNQKIIRGKTKDKNFYKLNNELFSSFGQDVPQEIKQVLNFSPLNIQYQHDASFLFSSSSGEVARYLNQVVNLDKIDSALTNISRKSKAENQAHQLEQTKLVNITKELEEYTWIDDADSNLIIIEKLDKEINITSNNIKAIDMILVTINEVNKSIAIENSLIKAEIQVSKLEKLSDDINFIQTKSNSIDNIIHSISKIDEAINNESELIKADSYLAKLEVLGNEILDIQKRDIAITTSLKNIKMIQNDIVEYDKNVIDLTEKFNHLFPDICPLCNQERK